MRVAAQTVTEQTAPVLLGRHFASFASQDCGIYQWLDPCSHILFLVYRYLCHAAVNDRTRYTVLSPSAGTLSSASHPRRGMDLCDLHDGRDRPILGYVELAGAPTDSQCLTVANKKHHLERAVTCAITRCIPLRAQTSLRQNHYAALLDGVATLGLGLAGQSAALSRAESAARTVSYGPLEQQKLDIFDGDGSPASGDLSPPILSMPDCACVCVCVCVCVRACVRVCVCVCAYTHEYMHTSHQASPSLSSSTAAVGALAHGTCIGSSASA